MARHTTAPRKYQLKELSDRHQKILQLAHLGLSPKQIADSMDLTPQAVSYVIHGELGQEKRESLTASADAEVMDISDEIKELSWLAVEQYRRILDGSESSHVTLRARVAGDVLSRAGYSPIQRVNAHHSGSYVHEHLEAIKDRAAKLGIIREFPSEEDSCNG